MAAYSKIYNKQKYRIVAHKYSETCQFAMFVAHSAVSIATEVQ